MAIGYKLVYLLMAITVLSAPLVACALPGLAMSEEEKECCLHMADQCGNSQMEESHSCCTKTPAHATGTLQPTVKYSPSVPQLVGDVAPGFVQPRIASVPACAANVPDHSKSPPGQLSVLRI